MFITSTTKTPKDGSTLKSDSNWADSRALRKLDYWCWLVIHVIFLHWLFIQNLYPNGFLYPMPYSPTQACYTMHQQFPLLPIAHILQ